MRRSRRENEFARCHHLPIREHGSHTSLADEYFTISRSGFGGPRCFREMGYRPQPGTTADTLAFIFANGVIFTKRCLQGLLLFEFGPDSGNYSVVQFHGSN